MNGVLVGYEIGLLKIASRCKIIVQVIRPGAPNDPSKKMILKGQHLTLNLAGVIKCTGPYNYVLCF